MRKIGRTRHHIRYFACAMAAVIGLLPPCAALAAQEDTVSENDVEEDESDVAYITAFEPLAEEDAYLSCMEKPDREELEEVFPETLLVWTEGEEEAVELEVDWESEEDFEETELACYVFYPEWDETQYRIADSAEEEIEIPTITVEVPADEGMIPDLEDARSGLQEIIEKKSILALVYLCEEYEVKSEPDPDADTVHTVGSGQSVQITDVELDESGSVWYQTRFYQNGEEYTGYIERGYLAASDEEFMQWEEAYIHLPAAPMRMMRAAVSYPDVDQFPASYQNALYELKKKHPNWVFVRMDTGIDWSKAISKELGDKSLVPSGSSGSWQTGVYGQGWSYASEGILKYYMDPRNFLTDPAVFQFEQLTYNDSYHTAEAVQEILKNSFMSSAIPGDSRTYAQAFNEIGKSTGVSPFHLASRVLQEQGTRGTSALISGNYAECGGIYKGYYNYFNVGASGKTNALVVQNGLKKAVELGWNTRYKSLKGGAYLIGANYILKGQDTLYLEKFNVSNGYHANFTHQYMQNILAPSSEASNIRKAYNNAGALENSFVFKIPVFRNMPASACSKPGVTDTITLDKTTISDLEVGKTVRLTPYVNGSKVDYISDMTFASDDSNVATVDSAGKVTAVSPGSVVISCTGKSGSTAVCTVTVVKAKPDVTTPSLSPCIYKEGLRLSDISLPKGWSWVKADTKIEVGTHTYEAVYTPEDIAKYDTVTKNISFTVTKTVPDCTMPEEPRVFVGATLGEITLPSGFSWESDTETELQEPGEYTFYVSYNPDENNYYPVEHIPFVVRVIGEASDADDDDDDTTTGGNTGTGTGDDSGTSTGDDSGTGTGSGSGSGSSTGTGDGSGTSTGDGSSTGTGNGSGSGTSTGDGGSTGTGSGSGSSSGTSTGDGSSTGTGSGSGSGSGTSTGSGSGTSTGDGGSTSTGTGSGSGTSTGTGSGSSTSTGSGSGTGTGDGSSTGTGSGSGSGSSTGTGSGSGTGTGSGSGSGSGTSTGVGAPLKDLPDQKTSTTGSSHATKKKADSGQPSQGGADNGQPTQNGLAGSQSPQSGAGSSQPTQSGTDSGQTAQNGTGSGQTVQNGTGSGQPSQSEAGAGQSTQAEHKTANGKTAGKETTSDLQAEVTEERRTQTQEEEISRTQDTAEEFSRPAVTMAMEDFTILTPEMLQMATEQNFDLVLNMGEYATWSVAIDSVDPDTVTEVDMGISLGTENVPTELIAAILDGNRYLEFTLAHDGPFGFQPTLRIAFDPANAGRYANLFYYNPEEQALEFICDVVIDESGIAAFPMEHASSYVIIVSDTSMAGVTAVFDSESHETPWLLIGVIVCVIAAGLGCGVFFWRKKMREEEETAEDEDDAEDEEDIIEADEEETYEEETGEKEYEVVDDEYDGYDEESEFPDEEADEESTDDGDVDGASGEKAYSEEDDWIEDEDWQEPETPKKAPSDRSADDHAEDDWIDDDEWDIGNDWIEDAEWEKRKQA